MIGKWVTYKKNVEEIYIGLVTEKSSSYTVEVSWISPNRVRGTEWIDSLEVLSDQNHSF